MQKRKLLDQVRDKIRFKHYSIKTEIALCQQVLLAHFFANLAIKRGSG
jgi:hypothetical protein